MHQALGAKGSRIRRMCERRGSVVTTAADTSYTSGGEIPPTAERFLRPSRRPAPF
jgi:hypothetical protein